MSCQSIPPDLDAVIADEIAGDVPEMVNAKSRGPEDVSAASHTRGSRHSTSPFLHAQQRMRTFYFYFFLLNRHILIKQQTLRNHDQDTERYEILVRIFMPTKHKQNILHHLHAQTVHAYLHACTQYTCAYACADSAVLYT